MKSIPSIKIDHSFSPATELFQAIGAERNDVAKNFGDGLPYPISQARYYKTRTNTFRLSVDQTARRPSWSISALASNATTTSIPRRNLR